MMTDGTAGAVLRSLATYGLQDKGQGKYLCNSPFRAGSDSHGFSLKIEDAEHGAYHDFVSGEEGSLYDLAQRLNIPLPERTPVAESLHAYRDLDDYAAQKGIPAETFVKAGWRPDVITVKGRPALEFKTQSGKRWRFIDGGKPKFISEPPYKACWYGLQSALKMNPGALIICNGEPSTVVAQHYGIPACCVTGGENKYIPQDLLTELAQLWRYEIIIALDCDAAGREGARKYQQDLSTIPFTSVRIIDLMLGEKGDLADFCLLHGETAYADLLKCPPLAPAMLPAQPTIELKQHDIGRLLRDLKQSRKSENTESTLRLLEAVQVEINYQKAALYAAPVTPVGDLIDQYQQRLDMARKGGETGGYSSGLQKLDDTIGKLRTGRILTILAETGVGKSTFSASIVSNLLNANVPGLAVTTESQPLDWLNMVVAHRTQITTENLDEGYFSDADYNRILHAVTRMQVQGCKVLDAQNPTPEMIESATLAAIAEHHIQWLLIDSGSNVSLSGKGSLYEKTEAAMDVAQAMARLGLIVIVTCQVGRNLEGHKLRIPTRHAGKGAGRIEENADIMLGLYNHQMLVDVGEAEPNPKFPPGTLAVRCLKHRRKGGAESKLMEFQWRGGIGVY